MGGRYTIRQPSRLLKLAYQTEFEEFSHTRLVPNFGIRPSTPVPIIRLNSDGRRVLGEASWGLIPIWSKIHPKIAPINAVSETVASNPETNRGIRAGVADP
jgi:putative SOS response-associated peptidase YedK